MWSDLPARSANPAHAFPPRKAPHVDGFLKIEKLCKTYNTAMPVFADVSFSLDRGEFVCIIGHSGCGKTTILNVLAGLDTATSGYVFMDGREVAGPSLERGVVFQGHALMPWMTVRQNIAFAVKSRWPEWPTPKVNVHVEKFVSMVGLLQAIDKKPSQLSGGMKQRVGIARAFSIQPKMLLLDEPFGALDALTRGTIQDELMTIVRQTQQTVFMITHDVDESILLADRILLMSNGAQTEAGYAPGGIAEVVVNPLPRERNRAPSAGLLRAAQPHRRLSGLPRHGALILPNTLQPQFNNGVNMNRNDVTEKIIATKVSKGIKWEAVAKKVGLSKEWVTAGCLGQMTFDEKQAKTIGKIFGLDAEEQKWLQVVPYKGSLPTAVPTDPLIYRWYEIVNVYGATIKELIHEEFGDGIMSAIDFSMDIVRQPDPKGDRVNVVLSGKFLPYKQY
jgi:nitrate/nitrite transport system ATP-binding protein